MVNEHVKDQMYSQDHGNSSDDDFVYNTEDEMHIADWEAYYERDLFAMWDRLRSYTNETGSRNYMINFADYTSFVEWCYNNSSKKMYLYPVGR